MDACQDEARSFCSQVPEKAWFGGAGLESDGVESVGGVVVKSACSLFRSIV